MYSVATPGPTFIPNPPSPSPDSTLLRGTAIGVACSLVAVLLFLSIFFIFRRRRTRRRAATYSLLEPLILSGDESSRPRSSTRSSQKRTSRGFQFRTPDRAPTAPPAYFDVIPLTVRVHFGFLKYDDADAARVI